MVPLDLSLPGTFSIPAYFCTAFLNSPRGINTPKRTLPPMCFLSPLALSMYTNTYTPEISLNDEPIPCASIFGDQRLPTMGAFGLCPVESASPLFPAASPLFPDPNFMQPQVESLGSVSVWQDYKLSGSWHLSCKLSPRHLELPRCVTIYFLWPFIYFFPDCWIQVTQILAWLYYLLFNLLFSYN